MNRLVPTRIKQCFQLLILNFAFYFLMRIVFIVAFGSGAEDYSFVDFLKAIYIGLKFDLRLAALLGVLTILLARIVFSKSEMLKTFWIALFSLIQVMLFSFYLIDFGHYAYLQTRVSATAIELLNAPLIGLQMAWETYPLVWMTLLVIVFGVSYFLILKKFIFSQRANPSSEQSFSLKRKAASWLIAFFTMAAFVYGNISWYPLRWSEAFFSTNTFISSLSLNPVLYFFDTRKFTEDSGQNQANKEKYIESLKDYLKTDRDDLRRFEPASNPKDLNIVIIVLESQAAFKSGFFGSTINPTPYLDSLAKDSLVFENYYVPTQATARSMFTLVTGLPDLSRVKTGSRNPYIVDQHSIINSFKKHEKFYFLGGSASWGNIRGVFSHNIDGLNIFEEGDHDYPKVDVWGISDYDLLKSANKTLKDLKGPFIAIVQSAGFHRPYTIPDYTQGFQVRDDLTEAELKANGFDSIEEYNSLRWQDYALGKYIEQAKKEKYYEDTIFVVYGDHGLPVNEAEHVPPGVRAHHFPNFHVPLIFHSPKHFKPERIKALTSQLDLWPTLASFLEIEYWNTTLGRNVLAPEFKDRNEAFVYYWYSNPPVFGVLTDEFFYKTNLEKVDKLYAYRADDHSKDVKSDYPEVYTELKNLALGLYYSSKYIIQNNKKSFVKPK